MLYATFTFWLLVIVFSAWGVHELWSRLVKPRVVNTVLLPGTLVAQLGHVLGLLVTGNSVQNTTLMSDDDEGKPQSDTPESPKVPVVGPIIIALLPLVACAACLYAAAHYWGGGVLGDLSEGAVLAVPQSLPTTVAGVWDLLRSSITLMEQVLNAIINSDWKHWPTIVFLYLAVCLTVRMTPFEGTRRGAIGAILVSGLLIALLASAVQAVADWVQKSWPILSFAVGMLLFLLLVSLLVTGVVGLIKVMVKNA